jgi:hypothetical protein
VVQADRDNGRAVGTPDDGPCRVAYSKAAKNVNSESERVRERKMSMVFNQPENVQQGREVPIHQVPAMQMRGIGEEGGKAGRLDCTVLRGLEL